MIEESSKIDKVIDVEKVMASKNEKLLKWLPSFVISYLKRIIHQDFINSFLHRNKELYGLDFVKAILDDFGITVTWQGLENIGKEDRVIIASNHPLGGMDGIALMYVIGQLRQDIQFPVNDILMNLPNLKELFVPINKHGSNMENARIIDHAFESDVITLFFPAGLVSRKQSGGIVDLEWKKTFIRKARSYKRDIIPTFISGRNSNWFYGLAKWRTRLGIKINIEMLYLVDEMVKQRGKEININFGSAISYQKFDRSKSDIEWAKEVKEVVYSMQNKKR
ncbi:MULTISPECIES: 1-acyl-sn-glycerol-3-phosphate acyltransferase [unclassified Lentimicrobium]|uniref:1-acyl-sn-glycerol-3-phosphate acyltransferase n=1 Tax=unclassified Lentimicrobium TaxID=2677434 RepID=UPI00155300FB|nr:MULTISPECIES: 1-acyl-sn-glycerol-3-phosphate acyltransferase [unclassified Lentimicrobium]NPD44328.1 glycerol acyltransferase [Lentimicrobium sp. S6]NPD84567.1 glycerol acyltransferase [Lentimicrobium sp. L6]